MRRTITKSVLLAFLLLVPAPGAGAQTGNDAACFIAKANESRVARGYAALAVDPTLTSIAAAHAQEMAQAMQAVPIDNAALAAKAPAGARLLGQNVGAGETCEGLNATFLSYPPEQNRILDPNYDSIGVGVATGGNRIYVSEILMQAGTARPAPTATTVASPTPKPSVSPSPSRAPSASPSATQASPTPSAQPTESIVAPSPSVSPSPSPTIAAERVSSPNRRVPLMVGLALGIVAAAALGALMQSRRGRP